MTKEGKISTLLVLLMLLVALGTSGFLYLSYEKEKNERKKIEQNLAELQDQRDRLQAEIAKAQEEKNNLLSTIHQKESLINDLNNTLLQLNEEKESLYQEKSQLVNKIKQLELRADNLQQQLDKKLAEINQLQSKLDNLLAEQKTKEEQQPIGQPQQTTQGKEELGTIVVSSEQQQVPTVQSSSGEEGKANELIVSAATSTKSEAEKVSLPVEGEQTSNPPTQENKVDCSVVLINKDYNFLILNKGSNDNVQVGDVFEVYHNKASIGKVKVEKVHPNLSAAGFLEGFRVDLVQEGDLAKSF